MVCTERLCSIHFLWKNSAASKYRQWIGTSMSKRTAKARAWRHWCSWDLTPPTLATAFLEYRHQFLKKNEVGDTDRGKKTLTLQLCLLEQRYSARETEICNSIWMITEGMSQTHIATACIVYVSHTPLSLSIIHLYLFYSIRVAKTVSCYKNKVIALLSAGFSKTPCASDLYSAFPIFKWACKSPNQLQVSTHGHYCKVD